MSSLRLHALPFLARIGLTGVLLTFAIGFFASYKHLEEHHGPRDGDPKLEAIDIEATYHGVQVPSPLRTALDEGHPEGLPEEEKQALLDWLDAPAAARSASYDDPDLGYLAPVEVFAERCIGCHARSSEDAVARELPLEYLDDDIEPLINELDLRPTPTEILYASAHTHALTMALLVLAIGGLALATRFPGIVRSLPIFLGGLALCADIASWFLAQDDVGFVKVILVAGATYFVSMGLGCALVFVELWLPGGDADKEFG